jgi:hypothetical protein
VTADPTVYNVISQAVIAAGNLHSYLRAIATTGGPSWGTGLVDGDDINIGRKLDDTVTACQQLIDYAKQSGGNN